MTISPDFELADGVKLRSGGGLCIELSLTFLRQQEANLKMFRALGGNVSAPQFIVDALEFFEAANGATRAKLNYRLSEYTTLHEEVGGDGLPMGVRIGLRFSGEDALRLDRLRALLRLPDCAKLAGQAMTAYQMHLWGPQETAAPEPAPAPRDMSRSGVRHRPFWSGPPPRGH